MDPHLPTCAQRQKRLCPLTNDEHRFSGWPGAFCLDCGDEDMDEHCLADGCDCPCHAEFWQMTEESIKHQEAADFTDPF